MGRLRLPFAALLAALTLAAPASAASTTLVINEIDYDQAGHGHGRVPRDPQRRDGAGEPRPVHAAARQRRQQHDLSHGRPAVPGARRRRALRRVRQPGGRDRLRPRRRRDAGPDPERRARRRGAPRRRHAGRRGLLRGPGARLLRGRGRRADGRGRRRARAGAEHRAACPTAATRTRTGPTSRSRRARPARPTASPPAAARPATPHRPWRAPIPRPVRSGSTRARRSP